MSGYPPVSLLTFTQHVHISPGASHAVQDTAISSQHTEKKQKAPSWKSYRMTVLNLLLKPTLLNKIVCFSAYCLCVRVWNISCLFFAIFFCCLFFPHLAHVSEAQVEVMHQGGVGGVVPHGQTVAAGHTWCCGDQGLTIPCIPRGHPATVGHQGVIAEEKDLTLLVYSLYGLLYIYWLRQELKKCKCPFVWWKLV